MSEPLTRKRKEWAKQFKAKRLKGTPVIYNAGVESRYAAKLARLTEQLAAETRKEVLALFQDGPARGYSQDASPASQSRILFNRLRLRFFPAFARKGKDLAIDMLARADKANAASVHESLKELSGGLSLKTRHVSGAMREALKAATAENVAMIRSIAETHLGKVEKAIMRSITSGNGLHDLIPELEKIGAKSRASAKDIAIDQTRKANAFMARHRMQACGVRKWEWCCSGGSQDPRELHHTPFPAGLAGGIFTYDDPPIIQKAQGNQPEIRGFPGDLRHCKCSMCPVIEFDDEEDGAE